MFTVGDRVKKIRDCYYSHAGDKSGVEIGEVGTIMRIRSRYENTPNAYVLYIVQFDNHLFDDNKLENQYTESSLELVSIIN
ncbi:hypothetical protein EB001_13290 [bacterium]|nr:hypothetical protein [bacterium]